MIAFWKDKLSDLERSYWMKDLVVGREGGNNLLLHPDGGVRS